jgi:steroid 5-alpha reductase family enzyme
LSRAVPRQPSPMPRDAARCAVTRAVDCCGVCALRQLLMFFGGLLPYWGSAYLITSRSPSIEAPSWLMAACTLTYAVGVATTLVSDAQKYYTLRVKRGLIDDGMFALVRHPNYLGEMSLYGAFAALSQHPAPWAVLSYVWLLVFLPNMLAKERSMSRYPTWAAYYARTGMLLPSLGGLWRKLCACDKSEKGDKRE